MTGGHIRSKISNQDRGKHAGDVGRKVWNVKRGNKFCIDTLSSGIVIIVKDKYLQIMGRH